MVDPKTLRHPRIESPKVHNGSQNPEMTGRAQGLDSLYEFEREPVTPDKFEPPRHFAGLFAGEHVAGTEFTIGAPFIALGATTKDVLIGQSSILFLRQSGRSSATGREIEE
jgi:hypothetical protein